MSRFVLFSLLLASPLALQAAPSFDCAKVEAGSIAELVCQTPQLAQLDVKLAEVYQQASAKAQNEHPPMLKAEQRGWLKGRDECWKADDKPQCVADSYTRRIAELQARYQLIAGKGPVFYQCDGQPAKEVVATYYATEPPTALVEFGDSSSLMYLQPSGAGARYQGQNESLWEHQGEAVVTWGYQAPEMRCLLR
ncbi:MliC family protein [Aquipseudomonas alcaligenes]|uniref:MliC family protein n=1 Tax=Aquipseudomonas alcaligenes TaxID=43263 RepID=UPI00374A2D9E